MSKNVFGLFDGFSFLLLDMIQYQPLTMVHVCANAVPTSASAAKANRPVRAMITCDKQRSGCDGRNRKTRKMEKKMLKKRKKGARQPAKNRCSSSDPWHALPRRNFYSGSNEKT